MKLHGTRVQYGFLLHRNCLLLENFIKFQNYKISKYSKFQFKIKKKKNFKNFIFSLKIQNFHKISQDFKKIQNDKIFKNFKVFIKFKN